MFCGYCGYKLSDNDAFCGKCGAAAGGIELINPPSQPAVPPGVVIPPNETTNNKLWLGIIAAIVGVLVLAVVVFSLWHFDLFGTDDVSVHIGDNEQDSQLVEALLPEPIIEVEMPPPLPTEELTPVPITETVRVPDFTGLTHVELVQNEQWVDDFIFIIMGEDYCDTVPEGSVISQSPAVDSEQEVSPLGERIRISLIISLGSEQHIPLYVELLTPESEIDLLIENKLIGLSEASRLNDASLVTRYINPNSGFHQDTVNLIRSYESRNIMVTIQEHTITDIRYDGNGRYFVDVTELFTVQIGDRTSNQTQVVTYTVDDVNGVFLISQIVIHEIIN